MRTELYHCTSIEGLLGILSSQAFYPSFCLEKVGYLKEDMDFAFAMVCFADLLPFEVDNHMVKFKSSVYLKVSKEWAIKNGVTPVIYYNNISPLSACFRFIIERTKDDLVNDNYQPTKFTNAVNILLGYLKQYEGQYWNKVKKDWSSKTTFFTEREWRYVPLVSNGEAYYLDPELFIDESFREIKQKELINHGYALRFSIDDILEIGVSNEKDFGTLLDFYRNQKFSEDWLAKTKLIENDRSRL